MSLRRVALGSDLGHNTPPRGLRGRRGARVLPRSGCGYWKPNWRQEPRRQAPDFHENRRQLMRWKLSEVHAPLWKPTSRHEIRDQLSLHPVVVHRTVVATTSDHA